MLNTAKPKIQQQQFSYLMLIVESYSSPLAFLQEISVFNSRNDSMLKWSFFKNARISTSQNVAFKK